MSLKKRIATLSAALVADISGYESGMNRASKITKDNESKISASMGRLEKAGLKLGLGLVGGGGALSMLTNEIRHVIDNIEKIPGVPRTTIDSVNQAKYAFAQSREGIDQAIASVISFTSWTARAAGFASGALVYGLDSAEEGYWALANAADRAATEQERQAAATKKAAEENAAAGRVLAHATEIMNNKITDGKAAYDRLKEASDEYFRSGETNDEKLVRLKAEAHAFEMEAIAARKAGDSIKAATAQAEAFKRLTAVDKTTQAIKDADYAEAVRISNQPGGIDYKSLKEITPDQYVAAMGAAKRATEKVEGAAKDLGWAFSSAFEDAILGGAKFSDVIDGLAQDIIRIAIRTAITNPIGQALGGALSMAMGGFFGMFGGGKAVGGPVDAGTTYMVGEKGPELFTPKTSGTIIPNHKLGDSSGRGGHVFNIDARGADRTGLARLESLIKQLNGSIEMRAIAAVADSRRRAA